MHLSQSHHFHFAYSASIICCQFNQLSRTNSISPSFTFHLHSDALQRTHLHLSSNLRLPTPCGAAPHHYSWQFQPLTVVRNIPLSFLFATRLLLRNLCCFNAARHFMRRFLNDTPNYPLCCRKCSDDCHLSCGCVGALVCHAIDMSHPSSTSWAVDFHSSLRLWPIQLAVFVLSHPLSLFWFHSILCDILPLALVAFLSQSCILCFIAILLRCCGMATVISAFDVVDFIFKAHESQSEDLQSNGADVKSENEQVR